MERITATIEETVKSTGMSRTRVYELIKAGQLDTVKLGRRRLVKVGSLQALLEAA